MSLPPVGMCRSPEDENASSPFSVPRQMEPILADGLQGRRIEDRYREALVAGRRHSMADPCRDGALGQISLLIFPFCSPTIGGRGYYMALTRRQKQVLDFISGFIDENGFSPSFEEIAGGLKLASLATVHKHISVLQSKNYLTRGFNQSRSLELSEKYLAGQRRPKPLPEIPLMGRIAAGAPVEAMEQHETLNFADFAGNGNTYALEVRGDSMLDDHICDGDLILLERDIEALEGDIVVALVGVPKPPSRGSTGSLGT